MSRHCQPEAVLFQGGPEHVPGPEAGSESETKPHHSVHAELRLPRWSQQTSSQPALFQPTGQQTAPPVRFAGASVHTLLGAEQSRSAACLHSGGIRRGHSRGAGPAAGGLAQRRSGGGAETEAVHTRKQARPPHVAQPQQRRV